MNTNEAFDNDDHLNANRTTLNNQRQHSSHPPDGPILQRDGGITEGAPLHVGGSRPQSTIRDRLFRQASGEVTGVCPVTSSNDEEYLSGMIRQIM